MTTGGEGRINGKCTCVEGYRGVKLGLGCVGQMETAECETERERERESWQGY